MRPFALAVAILSLVLSLPQAPRAQARGQAAGPEIRLVLLVAVDQYRYDYLTRFRAQFTGGLAQLLTRGATFTQAYLDHYPTVTAVGHSTMLSGAKPAVSGIIGNDWFDRGLGASVTSVSDPATQLVGGIGTGSSPHRLLVSTLGDELKNAAGDRAPERMPKVFGLSLKDRSAILPAGHRADAAYWYDTKTAAFVTSTYYRTEPHAWVAAFNARKPADAYAGVRWEFLDPASGPGRVMPAAPGPQLYNAVYGSPFGNDILKDLALAGLEAERLGQRGVTDVLSVSFSSNDSVGHTFGPDSPEVRDIAIRTDRVVGELLARVDALVGLERTVVVFTSDHGVAPVPEIQQQRRLPGGRMKADELFGPIGAALTAKYGEGRWILATAGTSPYLNHALIAEKGLDPAEVRRVAAVAAAGVPHVARVYTREQLMAGTVAPDVIGRRIAQSYHLQRSGDLEIVLDPYWLRSTSGTTHGTPYSYDAHIPLVLMGRGIAPGAYHATVALNDVVPTLAALLGVENPSGADGRVLAEALVPSPAPARPRGTH
jgi:predicted AlkP superfamily pyrophosphatase or phosphodiesterase